MEVVVDEVVTRMIFRNVLNKYKAELAKADVTKDTKFEYAWCLIRSKSSDDIKKGIVLLDGWYDGLRLQGNEKGWFPSTIVMEITNEHVKRLNLREQFRITQATAAIGTER